MTPYYADDLVTIYHGDALEVMPTLDPVDLCVTSPPYNLGRVSGAYANMRDAYPSHADRMDDAEYVRWQQAAILGMWTLLSAEGAIFYNHKPLLRDGTVRLPTRLIPWGVNLRQVIIWDRRVGMNWSPTRAAFISGSATLAQRVAHHVRDLLREQETEATGTPVDRLRAVAHLLAASEDRDVRLAGKFVEIAVLALESATPVTPEGGEPE